MPTHCALVARRSGILWTSDSEREGRAKKRVVFGAIWPTHQLRTETKSPVVGRREMSYRGIEVKRKQLADLLGADAERDAKALDGALLEAHGSVEVAADAVFERGGLDVLLRTACATTAAVEEVNEPSRPGRDRPLALLMEMLGVDLDDHASKAELTKLLELYGGNVQHAGEHYSQFGFGTRDDLHGNVEGELTSSKRPRPSSDMPSTSKVESPPQPSPFPKLAVSKPSRCISIHTHSALIVCAVSPHFH